MSQLASLAAALLFMIPQTSSHPTTAISGSVLDREGKPMANAVVVYSEFHGETTTGRAYKLKTNRKGEFSGLVASGYYNIEITAPDGTRVYTGTRSVGTDKNLNPEPLKTNVLNVDLSAVRANGEMVTSTAAGNISQADLNAIRKDNARVLRINQLLPELRVALDAQDWLKATGFLQQLIVLDPDRWEFYQNLGTIQANLTHYQDAIQTFTKGVEVAEKALVHTVAPVKAKADISNLLMGEGDAYNRLGQLDEALALYTKAAAIAPQPEVALYHACNAQSNNGRSAAAIDSCSQAIAIDPNQWEFYQLLAGAQNASGKQEDALQTYQKGIEVAKRIVEAKPDSAKAKTGMGQMLSSEGNLYVELKKYDEAIDIFNQAAEVAAYPAQPYFNWCATLYNIKHEQDAVAACDKAIASDPTLADAYYIKASILFGQGKLDQEKYAVPPGTREAMSKYLEYAPNGQHAQDVRAMLDKLDTQMEIADKPTAPAKPSKPVKK